MINIEEKYPKSTKVVVDFFLERLLESLKDDSLPEDFKENVRKRGVKPSMILTLINEAPRNLIDVFDANQIYIQVDVHLRKDVCTFSYSIPNYTEEDEKVEFNNRIECEKAAMYRAFEILEEKLV